MILGVCREFGIQKTIEPEDEIKDPALLAKLEMIRQLKTEGILSDKAYCAKKTELLKKFHDKN